MEKTFEPWAYSEGEQPAVPLFDDSHQEMSKVASSLDSVPDLKKYIGTAKPEKGWYFLLIHANGSDEVWGPNKKGDSFPLSDLVPSDPKADYGYRTFATNALGYVHHRNTPDRWTGRVLMADYNRDLGRVELIAKFNRARLIEEMAPYFAEALDKGELPAVSMGCRVAHDRCSICGHKASNPSQYCTHILHERLNTYPDGRRVRMMNIKPRFHDISLVSSPADPDARALLKIAELDTKLSAIEKTVPANTVGSLRRTSRDELAAALSTEHDPDISLDKLLKASRWGKHASLSAFTGAGVILRPHEYMALEFACSGKYAEAAEAYGCRLWVPVLDSNSTVPAFHWKSADSDLVAEILPVAAQRSVYVPALDNRAQGLKLAAETIGSLDHGPQGSDHMAVSYGHYRKTAEDILLSGKAAEWALNQPKVLVQVLGRDIPIFLKQAAIDSPKAVFAAVVRGYNVTTLA